MMITPDFFVNKLKSLDVEFYAGVPDSLLKNVCAFITDNFDETHNIIAANEGGAVALAAGYHLATGKIGCVYMQNSGEGNIINPLSSLTDKEVYHIPMLLLIGWRGRPGVHDEPQHVKQGKVTTGLLNVMGINYEVLSKDENIAEKQIEKAIGLIKKTGEVFALVVEKDTFDTYTLVNNRVSPYEMSREEAIQIVAGSLEDDAVIVSTTGMISRELFEYRSANKQGHFRDFLTVGSMGHASQIALGIAMEKPQRKIYCFDGDGAVIMHLGGMAIIGDKQPENLVHVVFNNGAHDSVGGQPTVGQKINLNGIALNMGYKHGYCAKSKKELERILDDVRSKSGPIFIEVMVRKGNRKDLGRPTTSPIQNKEALMKFLCE